MMIRVLYQSPIGTLLVVCSDCGLRQLKFINKETDAVLIEAVNDEASQMHWAQTKIWLDTYFSGKAPNFTPTLDVTGTEFQEAVWRQLLHIPYGETVSYGALAQEIAQQRHQKHMSAQAIGGAVGRNPIAIVVPCHRVIGADGHLTGYAGGLDKKEALLKHEGYKDLL